MNMKFFNTKDSFGLIAKTFHWVMAILILMMLTMGFKMGMIPSGPDKIWVITLHKSTGILILMLALARLIWRFISPRPDAVPTIKWWEDRLANIVHFLLYVVFIGMPLSGWLMSSAGDFPAGFFGLFYLPHVIPKNQHVFHLAREAHSWMAFGLIGLLAMHFAGAFIHHFLDHDATLRRMTWDRLGFIGGAVLALFAGVALALPLYLSSLDEDRPKPQAQAAQPQTQTSSAQNVTVHAATPWAIDSAASYIKFTATQYGQPFEGQFKRFGGHIFFDPNNLPGSFVDMEIGLDGEFNGTASISTGSEERDQQAQGGDWFDVKEYPLASFLAESFTKTGDNQYVAHGTLMLRRVKKPLDLPFSLDLSDGGKTADMHAEMSLNRSDFGVGQGQWKTTDVIGGDIKLSIYVKAAARSFNPSP